MLEIYISLFNTKMTALTLILSVRIAIYSLSLYPFYWTNGLGWNNEYILKLDGRFVAGVVY